MFCYYTTLDHDIALGWTTGLQMDYGLPRAFRAASALPPLRNPKIDHRSRNPVFVLTQATSRVWASGA